MKRRVRYRANTSTAPASGSEARGRDLPPAVILGAGTTALSMTRSLRAYGVAVTAVDETRSTLASHSRLFEFVACEGFYTEDVVPFLETLSERFPGKPALLPSGDEHVALLSRHRERLGRHFLLNLPAPEVAEVLLEKDLFAKLAESRGWPIPKTFRCDSEADIERATGEITFPAVLKPRIKNRATRTHSPDKAFRCETPEELLEAYRRLARWEQESIVQEWIPGGDDRIEFSLRYMDREGRDLVSFEGRKIRQYLPECGSTSFAEPLQADDVRELARTILEESGAAGYCSVEFKRDPRNGELRIMEPTIGRPNLQVGLSAANGVDIVYIGYCDIAGLPLPEPTLRRRPVRWILLPHDLRSARHYVQTGTLGWGRYLRSIAPPLHVLPWSIGDYTLLLAGARRLVRSFRRRLMRRTPAGE